MLGSTPSEGEYTGHSQNEDLFFLEISHCKVPCQIILFLYHRQYKYEVNCINVWSHRVTTFAYLLTAATGFYLSFNRKQDIVILSAEKLMDQFNLLDESKWLWRVLEPVFFPACSKARPKKLQRNIAKTIITPFDMIWFWINMHISIDSSQNLLWLIIQEVILTAKHLEGRRECKQ